MKTPIATFERTEKDGVARLELVRVYNLPKWYYKCTRENHEPLKDDQVVARTHEVCIKNVLPITTPEKYREMCRRSELRNKN